MATTIPIGSLIRKYRKANDLTQKELAEILTSKGYAYAASTVGWWETGRASPPIHDPEFVMVLAEVLEIPMSQFLEALGYFDSKGRLGMKDLSPIEVELLEAFRRGDVQKLIRLAADQTSEQH